MTEDGKRNRGRPELRWRDLVKQDMARNQMTTEMAGDRKHWHVMIQASTLRSGSRQIGEKKIILRFGIDFLKLPKSHLVNLKVTRVTPIGIN